MITWCDALQNFSGWQLKDFMGDSQYCGVRMIVRLIAGDILELAQVILRKLQRL